MAASLPELCAAEDAAGLLGERLCVLASELSTHLTLPWPSTLSPSSLRREIGRRPAAELRSLRFSAPPLCRSLVSELCDVAAVLRGAARVYLHIEQLDGPMGNVHQQFVREAGWRRLAEEVVDERKGVEEHPPPCPAAAAGREEEPASEWHATGEAEEADDEGDDEEDDEDEDEGEDEEEDKEGEASGRGSSASRTEPERATPIGQPPHGDDAAVSESRPEGLRDEQSTSNGDDSGPDELAESPADASAEARKPERDAAVNGEMSAVQAEQALARSEAAIRKEAQRREAVRGALARVATVREAAQAANGLDRWHLSGRAAIRYGRQPPSSQDHLQGKSILAGDTSAAGLVPETSHDLQFSDNLLAPERGRQPQSDELGAPRLAVHCRVDALPPTRNAAVVPMMGGCALPFERSLADTQLVMPPPAKARVPVSSSGLLISPHLKPVPPIEPGVPTALSCGGNGSSGDSSEDGTCGGTSSCGPSEVSASAPWFIAAPLCSNPSPYPSSYQSKPGATRDGVERRGRPWTRDRPTDRSSSAGAAMCCADRMPRMGSASHVGAMPQTQGRQAAQAAAAAILVDVQRRRPDSALLPTASWASGGPVEGISGTSTLGAYSLERRVTSSLDWASQWGTSVRPAPVRPMMPALGGRFLRNAREGGAATSAYRQNDAIGAARWTQPRALTHISQDMHEAQDLLSDPSTSRSPASAPSRGEFNSMQTALVRPTSRAYEVCKNGRPSRVQRREPIQPRSAEFDNKTVARLVPTLIVPPKTVAVKDTIRHSGTLPCASASG